MEDADRLLLLVLLSSALFVERLHSAGKKKLRLLRTMALLLGFRLRRLELFS